MHMVSHVYIYRSDFPGFFPFFFFSFISLIWIWIKIPTGRITLFLLFWFNICGIIPIGLAFFFTV